MLALLLLLLLLLPAVTPVRVAEVKFAVAVCVTPRFKTCARRSLAPPRRGAAPPLEAAATKPAPAAATSAAARAELPGSNGEALVPVGELGAALLRSGTPASASVTPA